MATGTFGALGVGYFCCSNSDVHFFCKVATINIIVFVSGTNKNVTKYIIILVSVIIGVGGWSAAVVVVGDKYDFKFL